MSLLRPATPEDVPLIRELAREIWWECYPAIIPGAQIEFMLSWMYAPEKLEADIRAGEIRFYLVTWNGAAVGFASTGPGEGPREIHLHKFYLQPAHHGQGLGSRVLRELISLAGNAGYREMSLRVNRQNQAACRCYERNGFTIAREVCSEIGGGFVMDDYWMSRPLSSTMAYPAALQEIIALFEELPEGERRELLYSFAQSAAAREPREGETYLVEDERLDAICLDRVGVFLRLDGQGGAHFRVRLGPKVQTLTRALTAILCQGLEGLPPADVLTLDGDFIPLIVGAELMRLRSRTVYYVLDRMREAARRALQEG